MGVARGARKETFFGLAGIGDLVTTCCSPHSRNRAVGEAIGHGESLQSILARMKMVAEGVFTTKALFGPDFAPFWGLLGLFAARQACQALVALPAPPGIIWRPPGFPSIPSG